MTTKNARNTPAPEDADDQDYAEAWRPEKKGDAIKGTVVSVVLGPDLGYGRYPIVTLDTEDGERAVHAFHTVLRRELAQKKPKPGDELEIVYQGERKARGSDRTFVGYRVRSDNEPEFDWSAEERAQEHEEDDDLPF